MIKSDLIEPYCKSVLKIQIPIVVTIARKRLPIDQLLRLVPGAMIQFNKAYDSPMTLEAVDQPIAEGDVVKVGDKFGVHITEIQSPMERFIGLTGGRRNSTDQPESSRKSALS